MLAIQLKWSKKTKRGFLSMLLGTWGASLLGNLLTATGTTRTSQGRGTTRAGEGRTGQDF